MFGRMRIYTVHVKPDDRGINFKPYFVKEGFNWPAFAFTLLWTLYQRLWVPSILLAVVEFLLVILGQAHVFTHFSMMALSFGVHVVVGFHANDWLRTRLKRQGYVLTDIAAADSFLRAEQRYLERLVANG